MIYLARDGFELYFGASVILSTLEAEPLTAESHDSRRITLTGYITADGDDAAICRSDVARLRGLLSKIVCGDGRFSIHIDGKNADLWDGRVTFRREAPFSGETAEQFTVSAAIVGGYFHRGLMTVAPVEEADGFRLPATTEKAFGTLCGVSHVLAVNGGDCAVPFTAELCPTGTVTHFRMHNLTTGKELTLTRSFAEGDIIRISTHRDSLQVKLIREGREYNLTGYADDSSELFLLECGENVIALGDGAPYTGTLSFTERFASF